MRALSAAIVAQASLMQACFLDPTGKNACMSQDDCLPGYTCARQVCERDPTWGCVDNHVEEPTDEPIALRLRILDESTEAPVAGVTVRLCPRTQLECEAPLISATSDADGFIDIEMVDEYLELKAAGYLDTIAMGVASLEVTKEGVTPLEVHFDLFSIDSFDSLRDESGVVEGAQHGVIEALARDCTYESAAGVSFQLDTTDDSTAGRYLINDIPSISASTTDAASGAAIFFNVPPGLRSVGAIRAETGESIVGNAPVAVITRVDWLSHVAMLPLSVRITDGVGN